jgi:hypothetical protein
LVAWEDLDNAGLENKREKKNERKEKERVKKRLHIYRCTHRDDDDDEDKDDDGQIISIHSPHPLNDCICTCFFKTKI